MAIPQRSVWSCGFRRAEGRTVTEAEWLASNDPLFMLDILEPWVADEVVSDRQLRLFVCACARRLWHLLTDETRENSVQLAERFVDGKASEEEILARCREIRLADAGQERPAEPAVASCCIRQGSGYGGPYYYCHEVLEALSEDPGAEEDAARSALLRDIFGNPFHRVAFDAGWRTEHTVGIASRMYEERDFTAMPILADALEEAGCDNPDIFAHCREPGVHVRGCWVVDLVLAK
jgi:hypothetical protein